MSRRRRQRGALKVGFLGLLGSGNLGNEASLAATVELIREVHPDAELTVMGEDPQLVEREHGLRAVPMRTWRREPGTSLLRALPRAVRARLAEIPDTYRFVRAQDLVVVPGMGVLEQTLGAHRPWGLPSRLLIAGLAGRLVGSPLVLLSVGAELPHGRLMRSINRWIVTLSGYCSARDAYSAEAIRAAGVRRDVPVVPDVVFALPTSVAGPVVEEGLVAVSVMAWFGSGDDRAAGAVEHERYLDALSTFVSALLDKGHRVQLIVGDGVDAAVADEVRTRVSDRHGAWAPVLTQPARSFDELLEQIAPASAVVASRYHNLVAALKLQKPTIALGYGPKSAALMADLGLARHSLAIADADAEQLWQAFDELDLTPEQAQDHLRTPLGDYARRAREQRDRILAIVDGPGRPPDPETRPA